MEPLTDKWLLTESCIKAEYHSYYIMIIENI